MLVSQASVHFNDSMTYKHLYNGYLIDIKKKKKKSITSSSFK